MFVVTLNRRKAVEYKGATLHGKILALDSNIKLG